MFYHGSIFETFQKRCLDPDDPTWSSMYDKKNSVFFFPGSWRVYVKREQKNIFKNSHSLESCMKDMNFLKS